MLEATDDTFDEIVLDSVLPVIVDFWAPWCGPCKSMKPILEQISEQYAGRVLFVLVNVEEAVSVASDYEIRSIPQFISFKGESQVGNLMGKQSKQALTDFVEALLSHSP
jgi:thioredoxin 1